MATSSKDYWIQRERENLEKNLKTEAEYYKEIEDIYRYTMEQIQKEIDSFYAKYASKEGISIAEAKKRASKLDMEEFSRKAKKYVEEKNFSKQANDEMRLYNLTMKVNRLELLKAQIGLELVAGFDELQQFYEEKLTERTMEEFQRQAGILGLTLLDNAKMAEAIVNASFKNATFSERIWTHQDLLRAELEKALRTGLIQGRNPRELARQIRKVFNTSIFNSERLMRTELARVQTEAQKQSYIRNGFDQYTYITCSDGKVCSECKPRNGKHHDVDDMMPGDNAPPMHPCCRCSTAAYIDDKSYNEWLEGYKDHGLSYADWKAKTAKFQGNSDAKRLKNDAKNGIINIKIDEFVPCLKDAKSGEILDTEVFKITDRSVLKKYNKKNGWNIDWFDVAKNNEVYALTLKGDMEFQGLVGLSPDKDAQAVYLSWASTAPRNNKKINGGKQDYIGVGGHLFAIGAERSMECGYDGVMYGFAANKKVMQHYIDKFGAVNVPIQHPYQIIIDEKAAQDLLNEYNYSWKE